MNLLHSLPLRAFATLSTFLHAWDTWWTRTGPPHIIAILRIAFGSYLLLYFGLRLPHTAMLFSHKGLTIPYDLALIHPILSAVQPLLTPPSTFIATLLLCALLAVLLCFTLGIATRTSACIACALYAYSILLSFHHYSTSYNRLFFFLLFTFTFSGAGKTLSFEMWRKKGSLTAWEPVSMLTQRLIAVQITATYLVVGVQKVWLPAWQGGEVLYYSFQGMWATPLAFWITRQPLPMGFYDLLVLITKCMEITWPVLFWNSRARGIGLVMACIFHLNTSLTIAAIWWFWAMPTCVLACFPPEQVYETIERWKAFLLRHFPRGATMPQRS